MQRMSRSNHRAALAALLVVTLVLWLPTCNLPQGIFPGATPTPTCVRPDYGVPDPGPIPAVSSTLVSNGVVYATAVDPDQGPDYLYALDAGTGRRLWRFKSRQMFSGANVIVVADGVAYIDYDAFADGGYGVAALGARNGKVLWTYETSRISSPSAIVSDGVVYALGDLDPADGSSSALYALRASDGKLLWIFRDQPLHYPLSLPTVGGDMVYVYSSVFDLNYGAPEFHYATLYGLHASDGKLLWYQRWMLKYLPQVLAPSLMNGVIYTTPQANGNVYAVRASDGRILWEAHADGNAWSEPIVLDGTVYVRTDGSGGIPLYAIDTHTGKLRVLLRSLRSGTLLAAADGTLYVQAQDVTDPYNYAVYAIDATSGAIRWFYHAERTSSIPVQMTSWGPIDRVVYTSVGDAGGTGNSLHALDAKTGTVLWNAAVKVTGFALTESNGRVFFGSGSYRFDPCTPPSGVGYVYALDASTGAVLWRYQIGHG